LCKTFSLLLDPELDRSYNSNRISQHPASLHCHEAAAL
jgi:hypothetical protein